MKKFLLVTFIGMALAMDVYAIVNDIIEYFKVEETETIDSDVGTVVYME